MPASFPAAVSLLLRKKLVLPERAVSLSPRKKQSVCLLSVYSRGSWLHRRNPLTLLWLTDSLLPSKERCPRSDNEPFSDSFSH